MIIIFTHMFISMLSKSIQGEELMLSSTRVEKLLEGLLERLLGNPFKGASRVMDDGCLKRQKLLRSRFDVCKSAAKIPKTPSNRLKQFRETIFQTTMEDVKFNTSFPFFLHNTFLFSNIDFTFHTSQIS